MRRSLPGILALVAAAAGLATRAPSAAAQQPSRIATVQPSDTLYEVKLTDGSSYIGQVVEARGDSVAVRAANGVRIQFHRAQVRSIVPARGRLVDGVFWREDPNQTRLFFAPTGRTLRRSEGYAGLFFILPFVGYGLTDAVTLSGGVPLIGGSEGGIPFFYLAPKVRVLSTESASLSAGVLGVGGGDGFAGIAYGVGTLGSVDSGVTVGAGLPFASAGGFGNQVVVMAGGERRVARKLKLLTENWLVPGLAGVLVSGGIRLLGERWNTDLGLGSVVSDGSFYYFPIVSFAYAFGGPR